MAIVPIGGTLPKKMTLPTIAVGVAASQPKINEEKITKQVFAIRNSSYIYM